MHHVDSVETGMRIVLTYKYPYMGRKLSSEINHEDMVLFKGGRYVRN